MCYSRWSPTSPSHLPVPPPVCIIEEVTHCTRLLNTYIFLPCRAAHKTTQTMGPGTSDALIWILADIPITDDGWQISTDTNSRANIQLCSSSYHSVHIFYHSVHIVYHSLHILTVLRAIFSTLSLNLNFGCWYIADSWYRYSWPIQPITDRTQDWQQQQVHRDFVCGQWSQTHEAMQTIHGCVSPPCSTHPYLVTPSPTHTSHLTGTN